MTQMSMARAIRHCALTLATVSAIGLSAPAFSQEPSAEHIAAARGAINAINATDQFDAILPNAAQNLKTSLIQTAPNLQEVISVTVDETALEMAGRRADLEREAALIYAKNFTLQELQDIDAFYNSESGKKLLEVGPVVTRELLQAAEVWSNGVARDLAQATDQALRARLGETPVTVEGEGSDTQ